MKKSVGHDIANRVISGFSSGLLLILAGQNLGLSDFARLQIAMTYGALLYWIFDLGLVGLAYVYAAQSNLAGFASCWKTRTRSMAVPFLALFLIMLTKRNDLELFFLIFIGLMESLVDSNLPIRQLLRSPLANNLAITGRKASQLILFSVLVFLNDVISLTDMFLVYGIPSLIIFISDSVYFGKYYTSIPNPVLAKSLKFFLQSSGTNLASLDLLLLDKFGHSNTIYAYTLIKRFYSFLMIPGSTYLRYSMIKKSDRDLEFKSFIVSMRYILIISFSASVMTGMAYLLHANLMQDKRLSPLMFFIVISLVFIPTLGSISTNLNGALVGHSRYRFAAIATFSSSCIYLSFLIFGFKMGFNEYVVLIVAIYLNLLSEIWFEFHFLFSKSIRKKRPKFIRLSKHPISRKNK